MEVLGQVIDGKDVSVKSLRQIQNEGLVTLGRVMRTEFVPGKGKVVFDPRSMGPIVKENGFQPGGKRVKPIYVSARHFLSQTLLPIPYEGAVEENCVKLYSGVVLPSKREQKKVLEGPGAERRP